MHVAANAEAILKERILQADEPPDGMAQRVAKHVANGDAEFEKQFYEMLSQLHFLPNSPCLMNAGTPINQLCACFVLPIEDSMNSIFDAIKNMALVQKSGGGTGFSFSRLRPANAPVSSTGGVASGPVSFLKVFNAATEEIKQGGRRRGASLAVLRVDHPDILEFTRCKRDTDQIRNFNISVGITDAFMEAVSDDALFKLVDPKSGEVVQTVKAREIWDEIVHNAWETGEPGLLFLDEINDDNPTPGEIEACNPCGEATLLPWESCVLGSINLSRTVSSSGVDYGKLAETTELAVVFLDNVIDVSEYPLPQIEQVTKANRKIGLGIMGLADMLFKLGIPYDSDEALAAATDVMEFINGKAVEASEKLAKERGPFPSWKQSVYRDDKPRRNAVVTSIAPTGTLSAIAGTTFGIEPEYALVYEKTILGGKKFNVVNPVFELWLKQRGYYSELLIEKIKAQKGSIQNIQELPLDIRDVFKVAHDIAPEWHVKMQSNLQEYVDQSISKTINLPESASVQDVADVYFQAWDRKCKGVTVYRDGARPHQVLSTKYVPTERPQVLDGRTYKYRTGCGSLYVTVNRDLAGEAHELFSAHSKNNGCVNALLNALSRVTSIALRSGVDPKAIIKTMIGQDCGNCEDISSCADAVGLALRGEIIEKAAAEISELLQEDTGEEDTGEKESCTIGAACVECG